MPAQLNLKTIQPGRSLFNRGNAYFIGVAPRGKPGLKLADGTGVGRYYRTGVKCLPRSIPEDHLTGVLAFI